MATFCAFLHGIVFHVLSISKMAIDIWIAGALLPIWARDIKSGGIAALFFFNSSGRSREEEGERGVRTSSRETLLLLSTDNIPG